MKNRANVSRAGLVVKIVLGIMAVGLSAEAQTISGNVSTTFGVPIPGVIVTAAKVLSAERHNDTTDASGNYRIGSRLGSDLSGTYSVSASAPGYTFTPASDQVTVGRGEEVVNFTTPATAPGAITTQAAVVTPSSASLRGEIRPNGAATRVWFEYGQTASYGSISSSTNVGSGTGVIMAERTVVLLNNTTYHYRAVASNSFGVRYGADMTVTTLSGIPIVWTVAPTLGSSTGMQLNGMVTGDGANTTVWFDVGTTTNYGFPAVPRNLGTFTHTQSFHQELIGLSPGTTYHYRAVASSSFGTNYGADLLFTPAFDAPENSLSNVSAYNGNAWGDFDNDGLVDIISAGNRSEIWRNRGGNWGVVTPLLPSAADGSTGWADFNNDNQLDVLLSGWVYPNFASAFLRVYRNQGDAMFSDSDAGLRVVARSATAWADYDNDGRLDIIVTGLNTSTNPVTQLWRNTGKRFTLEDTPFPGVAYGAVGWGDYDNDGWVDLLLTGAMVSNRVNLEPSPVVSQIWRNTGTGFSNINVQLPGISGWNNRSAVAWGDFNADGLLDFALAGTTNGLSSGAITQIWRNTGDGFELEPNASLTPVVDGSLAWGDYDNDGRIDVLLSGQTAASGPVVEVWRNTETGFMNIGAGLPGRRDGGASWGDYDNDGRLDIFLNGLYLEERGQLWRNFTTKTNSPPGVPSGLAMSVSNSFAVLSWNASSDAETPRDGLTYNVRIGTTPGGWDIVSPMAGANGFRRIPQLGNAQARLHVMLENYKAGTPYYWTVQAIDGAYAGSPFASESSFKILPTAVPVNASTLVPGDANGDRIVEEDELNNVLANYWSHSPLLHMTNAAKLNDGFFQFALTNDAVWNFSVEVTTNFLDWELLGPAFPVYQFHDPESTNQPQRYYRLSWP